MLRVVVALNRSQRMTFSGNSTGDVDRLVMGSSGSNRSKGFRSPLPRVGSTKDRASAVVEFGSAAALIHYAVCRTNDHMNVRASPTTAQERAANAMSNKVPRASCATTKGRRWRFRRPLFNQSGDKQCSVHTMSALHWPRLSPAASRWRGWPLHNTQPRPRRSRRGLAEPHHPSHHAG